MGGGGEMGREEGLVDGQLVDGLVEAFDQGGLDAVAKGEYVGHQLD